MLKISHLITSLNVGGAEMSLLRLLSTIKRERYTCDVVSLIEPGYSGLRLCELGFRVRSLGMKHGRAAPSGLLRLVHWLRRDRPDILLTWLYHADLLGLLAGKLAGVRSIVWNLRASEMDWSKYNAWSGYVFRFCSLLSRLPNAVIVNSERGKAHHEKIGYKARRWVLIRNGVDHTHFKPDAQARESVRSELGLHPDTLLVGLVARFDPMKDHENFLSAVHLVAQSDTSVQFVLIGFGVDVHNEALTKRLNHSALTGRVHLLGERYDTARLTAALDIACSSSRSEAFPNAVVEAMACGVICVVTDVGDSRDIVGNTGIVVPPGRPDALAEGLRQATNMGKQERHRLGCAARRRVTLRFGMEQFVAGYEALFESLAVGRSGRLP